MSHILMQTRSNIEILPKNFTTKSGMQNHIKNKICPKLKKEAHGDKKNLRFDGSKTKVGFAI